MSETLSAAILVRNMSYLRPSGAKVYLEGAHIGDQPGDVLAQ